MFILAQIGTLNDEESYFVDVDNPRFLGQYKELFDLHKALLSFEWRTSTYAIGMYKQDLHTNTYLIELVEEECPTLDKLQNMVDLVVADILNVDKQLDSNSVV